MNDYFKLRKILKQIQAKLQEELEVILLENGYGKDVGWFNFNQDTFIIIWTATTLPKRVLTDLEAQFGEIDYVYTSSISQNIQINFKRDDE